MPAEKPAVKPESEYVYRNKFTNKEVQFTAKPDEVVATFSPATTDEEAAFAVMEETSLAISQGINVERGFAVFQVGADQDTDAASRSLEEQAAIANTIPVLIDDEGLTRYVLPDEFTVQFKEDVSAERAQELIGEKGSSVVVQQRTPGYYTLAVPEGKGLFETLREWSELDEVLFAEPSEAGFDDALVYIPDDPEFGRLWGLRNTGQTVNSTTGTADADIDATEAWDLTRGNANVVVAVIDTGADLNHPDLSANILARGAEDWDFAEAADPVPDDGDGHGTHVAGTVAAVDNAVGVIGVAPSCRVMPLRVNLTAGMNQNRADAINYVAAQAGANPGRRYVINCSWRMNGDHAGVHNAIINAVNANVVVCFAAGNANQNTDTIPQYPGVYPEVVSVAATDQRDRRATFSNFGTNVDVAAPGVNIYSTYPDDSYTFLDGTSMASPHVAGLAALVWSRNLTLSNQQVRQTIENTCDNIDALNPGFVGLLGRGRINAFRALQQTPLPALRLHGCSPLQVPAGEQRLEQRPVVRARGPDRANEPSRTALPDTEAALRANLLPQPQHGRCVEVDRPRRQRHDRQPRVGSLEHPSRERDHRRGFHQHHQPGHRRAVRLDPGAGRAWGRARLRRHVSLLLDDQPHLGAQSGVRHGCALVHPTRRVVPGTGIRTRLPLQRQLSCRRHHRLRCDHARGPRHDRSARGRQRTSRGACVQPCDQRALRRKPEREHDLRRPCDLLTSGFPCGSGRAGRHPAALGAVDRSCPGP